jgi:hypothetical protein
MQLISRADEAFSTIASFTSEEAVDAQLSQVLRILRTAWFPFDRQTGPQPRYAIARPAEKQGIRVPQNGLYESPDGAEPGGRSDVPWICTETPDHYDHMLDIREEPVVKTLVEQGIAKGHKATLTALHKVMEAGPIQEVRFLGRGGEVQ